MSSIYIPFQLTSIFTFEDIYTQFLFTSVSSCSLVYIQYTFTPDFFYVSIYTHYLLTSHSNLSASQPIISFSMRFDIVSSLLAWQDEKSSWASAPVVNHAGTYVSLSDGVGENAKSPDGVPNPPLFHPTHSKYQFDPGQFKGIGDYPALCQMLKDACPGCTLYEQRKDTERHRYQL